MIIRNETNNWWCRALEWYYAEGFGEMKDVLVKSEGLFKMLICYTSDICHDDNKYLINLEMR